MGILRQLKEYSQSLFVTKCLSDLCLINCYNIPPFIWIIDRLDKMLYEIGGLIILGKRYLDLYKYNF